VPQAIIKPANIIVSHG